MNRRRRQAIEDAINRLDSETAEDGDGDADGPDPGDPLGPLSEQQYEHIAAICEDADLDLDLDPDDLDPDDRPDRSDRDPTRHVPFNAAEKSEETGDGLTDHERDVLNSL